MALLPDRVDRGCRFGDLHHSVCRRPSQRHTFFAVVWFGSPHEPYSGLSKDLARYKNLPKSYQDRTVNLTSNLTGKQTTRPLHAVLQERYAEITALDRSIGKLRKWLVAENLRENTLLWYCGDNGSPNGASTTTPLRGQKATMYEGGVRVPGIIEWPARIPKPRVSGVNPVTSDTLPTICDLLDLPTPKRPLDGISLKPLIDGEMEERAIPICFWQFDIKRDAGRTIYIKPELQSGTIPLVKMLDGLYTRNFVNYQHKKVTEQDFKGSRVILDNRYKLVVNAKGDGATELFDVRADASEENNLAKTRPKVVLALRRQLREWQQSVLNSMTGADYR